MTKRAAVIWQGFLRISLWLASAGLMLASSGMDGAYLAKLMPAGWHWLGLVLNTVSDVVSEIVMYWFGRLRQDRSSTKRKLAWWLVAPQVVLVGYAWLFGWRQLLPIMRGLEPEDYRWLAPTAAGFVPVGIVSVGFVQALLAGRIESASASETSKTQVEPEAQPAYICPQCGKECDNQNALNAHIGWHKRRSNGREPQTEREEVAA